MDLSGIDRGRFLKQRASRRLGKLENSQAWFEHLPAGDGDLWIAEVATMPTSYSQSTWSGRVVPMHGHAVDERQELPDRQRGSVQCVWRMVQWVEWRR
jgi:hypothetical protein